MSQTPPQITTPFIPEGATQVNIEPYRALFTLSNDGIYRVEYVPPIDTTLSIEDQMALSRQNGTIVECNETLARQFGFENAAHFIQQLRTSPPAPHAQAQSINRAFILNGYRLDNVEIQGDGNNKSFVVNSLGVLENGYLVRTWNVQQEITERKWSEDRLQDYAIRLENKNKELAALHRVAVAAANATAEDDLIDEITQIIGRTLYPDVFGVLLIDEDAKVLRPHPSYRGIDDSIKNRTVPLYQGITGQVAVSGQPWRVNDVTREPAYVALYETIRSEMAVPIKMGQRIIGLLNVESVQSNAFSEADERLLSICAGQLATAIERLRTEAKEQRRQAWLEKVLELGKAVTAITEWTNCIQAIYSCIRYDLQFDRVGLFRYDPSHHTVSGLLGTDRLGHPEDTSWFVQSVDKDTAFSQVLAHPKGFVFHEDLHATFPRPAGHEMYAVKNHATVAAWAGDKPVAVITVDNALSHRSMTEEQLEALRLFAGYVGMALENARLLDQVRQAETKYRSIFENSVEGIFQASLEGYFLSVNPAIAAICGYESVAELMDRRQTVVSEIYADPQQRLEVEILNSEGEIHHFEFQVRQKGGNLIWVSLNARAIYGKQAEILYYEGSLQDIDQRKKAELQREQLETQLRQAQKMEAIGRLTGGIAHDFNNLLTVILSASDLLIRLFPEEDDGAYKWIMHIKQAGEKAAALIRQLLAYSRQQVLELTILDMNEVTRNAAAMFQRLIGEDIELILDLQPNLGRVMADTTQLEQVLLNLVVNARDAMPGGGKLIIQTGNVLLDENYCRQVEGMSAGWYTMLAVSDTGIGMDVETQTRIFEPFYTTKELGKGTGLGLATVYGIVRQSGGHVAVYSEPNMGATFKVYLPHAGAEIPLPQPVPTLSDPGRGHETILLVEDDAIVRDLAQEVLTQAGYVILAVTGEDAIALMEQYENQVDLLLTDVVMPRISGRELADQLLKMRPQLKVLFMSGYADALIRHHGLLQTGLAFLPKPFTPLTLTRKVRETLDHELSNRSFLT